LIAPLKKDTGYSPARQPEEKEGEGRTINFPPGKKKGKSKHRVRAVPQEGGVVRSLSDVCKKKKRGINYQQRKGGGGASDHISILSRGRPEKKGILWAAGSEQKKERKPAPLIPLSKAIVIGGKGCRSLPESPRKEKEREHPPNHGLKGGGGK